MKSLPGVRDYCDQVSCSLRSRPKHNTPIGFTVASVLTVDKLFLKRSLECNTYCCNNGHDKRFQIGMRLIALPIALCEIQPSSYNKV